MINDINDARFNELAEAKRLGHQFMKIYLNRSKFPRNQKQLIICGAVILRGHKKGNDGFGNATYIFEEKRGESMIFEFDPSEREFICWLYDDPGNGYFSTTGYNRDLLASHFEDGFFVIKDPELYADIKARYEELCKMKETGTIKPAKKLLNDINAGGSISDIESQIKFLEARKKMLSKLEQKEEKETKIKEETFVKTKKEKSKKLKEDELVDKSIRALKEEPQEVEV